MILKFVIIIFIFVKYCFSKIDPLFIFPINLWFEIVLSHRENRFYINFNHIIVLYLRKPTLSNKSLKNKIWTRCNKNMYENWNQLYQKFNVKTQRDDLKKIKKTGLKTYIKTSHIQYLFTSYHIKAIFILIYLLTSFIEKSHKKYQFSQNISTHNNTFSHMTFIESMMKTWTFNHRRCHICYATMNNLYFLNNKMSNKHNINLWVYDKIL